MKFCCGITLYYPTDEELNIAKKYENIFEKIYLFDNTEGNSILKNKKSFYNLEKYTYISFNENKGLAEAYNIMCKKAITDGFDYILLLDQDSIILKNDLMNMINYIEKEDSKDIGVFLPNILYNHMKEEMLIKSDFITNNEVEWGISSGSFINLYIYSKTLGFDEKYFIDRLDYDYCICIRKMGYKIVRIKNAYLHQALGESVKRWNKCISQHNSIRHYYIFRNRLYFYFKKNNRSIYNLNKSITLSLNHVIRIIFLEDNKIEKIRMILEAYKDFSRNKMGKYYRK
ncbi:glycosyltransferase [Clostridium perfringens]|uniref:glycosyltransferase n=1 Tax=Clostridium perfringens TaxID=1502 RepID=UPI000F8D44E3|nr:glycosyltransferase [Clostridium perfringens]RUR38707.1 glycosyltransferase [Clostridium perfringens]